MTHQLTRGIRMVAAAPLLLATLGGCVYSSTERVERQVPGPVVVAAAPSDRIVYPEGRWQLSGDGKTTPYYWVWIPAGPTPPVLPPYPVMTSPVMASPVVMAPTPSDRIVYADGRWQLYGDGKTTPYYWVWVPSGGTAAFPTPPPIPQGR